MRETINYCAKCGDARFSSNGKWRGDLCSTCAADKRAVHLTRKCAGCDVLINLRDVGKSNRSRVKYHSHECYAAHKASKFPPLPESKVCPCGATMTRGDLSYGNWKKKVFHDRKCADAFRGKLLCVNPKS